MRAASSCRWQCCPRRRARSGLDRRQLATQGVVRSRRRENSGSCAGKAADATTSQASAAVRKAAAGSSSAAFPVPSAAASRKSAYRSRKCRHRNHQRASHLPRSTATYRPGLAVGEHARPGLGVARIGQQTRPLAPRTAVKTSPTTKLRWAAQSAMPSTTAARSTADGEVARRIEHVHAVAVGAHACPGSAQRVARLDDQPRHVAVVDVEAVVALGVDHDIVAAVAR